MTMFLPKKNTVKSLFFALIILSGVIGTSMADPGAANAAAATPQIGIVDYTYLINHHPDTAKANEALQVERDAAQKEYNEKAVVLNDTGKKELERQMNLRVEQKRLELLKPITDQINAAIKTVADAKKLIGVAYKESFNYGGVDITQEVAATLNEK
jgi:outer membrane protein